MNKNFTTKLYIIIKQIIIHLFHPLLKKRAPKFKMVNWKKIKGESG